MATLYKQDGTVEEEVKPENGSDFTLEELRKILDCEMIQIIHLDDGNLMILDEEGKLEDHYINRKATEVARTRIMADDYIAGHALVCSGDEVK